MKIAMLVYSKTGNTKSVADELLKKLMTAGHTVDYFPLEHEPKEKEGNALEKVVFKEIPDLSDYDRYLFGGSVEAFNLVRVLQQYLKEMPSLTGKAVCLTTQQFMKSFLGGNRSQRTMKRLLEAKGLTVVGGANVNWKEEDHRAERIEAAVVSLYELLIV